VHTREIRLDGTKTAPAPVPGTLSNTWLVMWSHINVRMQQVWRLITTRGLGTSNHQISTCSVYSGISQELVILTQSRNSHLVILMNVANEA
jgi:hypothetical protein